MVGNSLGNSLGVSIVAKDINPIAARSIHVCLDPCLSPALVAQVLFIATQKAVLAGRRLSGAASMSVCLSTRRLCLYYHHVKSVGRVEAHCFMSVAAFSHTVTWSSPATGKSGSWDGSGREQNTVKRNCRKPSHSTLMARSEYVCRHLLSPLFFDISEPGVANMQISGASSHVLCNSRPSSFRNRLSIIAQTSIWPQPICDLRLPVTETRVFPA